jgi:uncharacterized protein
LRLEIGRLMSCAGADANCEPFLAKPVGTASSLVQRNCLVPMRLYLRFAPAMRELFHGGVGIVSSGASLVGAPNMLAYAFSKPFDMVMGERVWAQSHEDGVDVLALANLSDEPTWFVGEMRAMRNSLCALLDGGGGAEEPFPTVHGSRA